jgi:hypothetical protein
MIEKNDWAVICHRPNESMHDESVKLIGWFCSRAFGEAEWEQAKRQNPDSIVHLVTRCRTAWPDKSTWYQPSVGGK